MKPFLLLATRGEDVAADDEYDAMLRFSGLEERHLRRIRLEQAPLPPLSLEEFSGIVIGGSPFNSSDAVKTPVQQRVEADLIGVLDEVVRRDFPFLGACYGIGTLGTHQGGVVDRTYSEPVGPVHISLTAEGRQDPLFCRLPHTFEAFVGHKEAITSLPGHAAHLASSPTCPVQAFRIGRNVYATQFHPELDVSGLETRIDVYKHAGYFDPSEADALKALARSSTVEHPPAVLRAFVETYADTYAAARRRVPITPCGV